MLVAPLPMDPGSQARMLLHHVLEHGDIAGQDAAGRTLITLAVNAWTLDQLLAFDAAARISKTLTASPEPDNEIDGPPASLV